MLVQKDYLFKIIQQLSDIIKNILELKKSGKTHDAIKEIENASIMFTGLYYNLVRNLDMQSISSILKIEEQIYPAKCYALAYLLKEEADIYEKEKRIKEATDRYLKSLYLFVEVVLSLKVKNPSYIEQIKENIDFILGKFDRNKLPEVLTRKLKEYEI